MAQRDKKECRSAARHRESEPLLCPPKHSPSPARLASSRNHREAPAHHQNSSLKPYCMMRGFTLIALIFPKVLGLETLLAGFAKFG